MENINIVVNKSTRMIQNISKRVLGNDGENLQENLVFSFDDEFVDGQARLELTMPNDTNSYITLTKVEETYQIPVKSVMTQEGKINMQLVVTEGTDEENIPVFKSNVFYLKVSKSINAVDEAPDGYSQWINIANTKLNQMDNFDISASKSGNTATVSVTNRLGSITSVSISDGAKGDPGYTPVKGVDYYTDEEKEEMIDYIVENSESSFNQNVVQKTNAFNSNATSKLDEYNENAQDKMDEYDEHVSEMQEEVDDLRRNQKQDTVEGTIINVDDAFDTRLMESTMSKSSTQDGTPTPENPVEIETIKGNVGITISDGTNTKNYTIPLGNNEIVGIGSYQDELIIDKNGNCWLNKQTKKIILNGQEEWKSISGSPSFYYMVVEDETIASRVPLSSHFVGTSQIYANMPDNRIKQLFTSSQSRIYVKMLSTNNNVNNFKEWLTRNNVIVYCPIESTEEDLINLNYNVDIQLFNGVNNISNSENMDMQIKYVQDINIIIDNLTNAMLEIGGGN